MKRSLLIGISMVLILAAGLWLRDYVKFGRYDRHASAMLEDLDEAVGLSNPAEPGTVEIGKGPNSLRNGSTPDEPHCTEFQRQWIYTWQDGTFDRAGYANATADYLEREGWDTRRYSIANESLPGVQYFNLQAGRGIDNYTLRFYEDQIEAVARTYNCEHAFLPRTTNRFVETDTFTE